MVEVKGPDNDFLINFIFRLLISSSKRGATNKFPRLPSENEIKDSGAVMAHRPPNMN
jgi:hypothetical protein